MHVDMLKICHQIELREEEAVPIKHPWGGRIPVTTQGVRKESPPPNALRGLVFGDGLGKRKSLPSALGYAFLTMCLHERG